MSKPNSLPLKLLDRNIIDRVVGEYAYSIIDMLQNCNFTRSLALSSITPNEDGAGIVITQNENRMEIILDANIITIDTTRLIVTINDKWLFRTVEENTISSFSRRTS